MTAPSRPVLRIATEADAPAVQALMRQSVDELFPGFHTSEQTAAAVAHVAHLDPLLIADRTYFVHEADGELVACGGWSRRSKLYAGSGGRDDDTRLLDPRTEAARVRAMFVRRDWTRRGLARAILDAARDAARGEGFRDLVLMATLPGVPLYRAYGFAAVEETTVELPDGTTIGGVLMTRPVD